jgi:hypothetical protein
MSRWRQALRRTFGLIPLTLAVSVTGCVMYVPAPHYAADRRGRISVEILGFIHSGTTTREDVLLRLGEAGVVEHQSMVFGYGARWVGGWWNAGADIREEFLLIAFVDDGTVTRYEVMAPSFLITKRCDDGTMEYWYRCPAQAPSRK